MSSIEINTSQNVTIEYELASLKDRILGYFLDILIMVGGLIILFILYMIIFDGRNPEYFAYFVSIPIFFFYTLFFEILNNGQSLGKMALRIKVVKLSGKEPELNDYLTRWVFRMVDIYFSAGSVASLLVSSSGKNQRLGDILANTTVIKFKPNYSLNLNSLLNRVSLDTYQPQYPEVRRFNDEDMLLVKTLVERVHKYPNQAHQEALIMLTEKIKAQLNIQQIPSNRIEFLKTLLKDYIVLTR